MILIFTFFVVKEFCNLKFLLKLNMYAKITFQKAKVYNTLIFVIHVLVHKQFHNARKLDNTKKIVIFFWTKINLSCFTVFYFQVFIPILNITSA